MLYRVTMDVCSDISIKTCMYTEGFPPVQTGPGAHPASCKMGTGSFPGVEEAGAWG